ncbi:hypothetical protein Hs30E_06990 [Lactococcus hodotermopsidis]|uniref:Tr-type G domain-containing protein n=1 Tax=Pseudolactococcus hodotermopsidis TaxID=2709157 RepID=A0A6A0BCR0_9LACT|nr:TetM/TetW/TetO/TetS family tetracycline resistance ribosomal protection protein [Lactococcus hodotermopsidis]GFH42148.1 hypothetical protein Hs30E_06990 [Lactococcus hodotermopsidis]
MTRKKIVIGILAHVDAGKTTLIESILYQTGVIRELGRVDHEDAFLDTHELEKKRGITIFSKQARLELGDFEIVFLDTPGHSDFMFEMARTLQVLDYAILVVDGSKELKGYTKTLWDLLAQYEIPTVLFVNKMDKTGSDKLIAQKRLQQELSDTCLAFDIENSADFYDSVALLDETLMANYLETGKISDDEIADLIGQRLLFPCFYGSALRLIGTAEFLTNFPRFIQAKSYPTQFGARVFKISRDEKKTRLTHLKIMGGKLKVKDMLSGIAGKTGDEWSEKVEQIRLYSGGKYETVQEVSAGNIVAITGLTQSYAGQSLGNDSTPVTPVMTPIFSYAITVPIGVDTAIFYKNLQIFEEENPELHIVWYKKTNEIHVRVMGEVQIEILKSVIFARLGLNVTFKESRVVYQETIAQTVYGVGHFEPLRHYSEVHVLLEPLPRGAGLQFANLCSEEMLEKSYQKGVMTHLQEKSHLGVLTGSAITDVKITLLTGRAHNKHTHGGDFREATYRAVRHGLRKAESVLLEPYYYFDLAVPVDKIGRAMSDLTRMQAEFSEPQLTGDLATLSGTAPAILLQNYQAEITAYTSGNGNISLNLAGYDLCHNADEVIADFAYDIAADLENTADSVFCGKGKSFLIAWDEVENYRHLENPYTS